jgi:hypothetical protein
VSLARAGAVPENGIRKEVGIMAVYTKELDEVPYIVDKLAMLLVTDRTDMKVLEKYRAFEDALRRAHYVKTIREFIVRWETAGCPKQFEGLNMRHRLADRMAKIAARDTTVIRNPQELEKRKTNVSAK